MNWLSTDVGKAQRDCRQYFACLILACAVALVVCQTEPETHWSGRKDAAGAVDTLFRPNKVQWKQHGKADRHSSESFLRVNSNAIQSHNKQEYQKKGHGKHKKHTRNRSKSRGDFAVSQDKARRNNLNYLQSEKKYFDYFPTEDTPEKLVPQKDATEEEVQVVVLLLNDTDTSKPVDENPGGGRGRGHSRSRSKREIPRQETYVGENYNYVRNFLAGEQGNKLPLASLPNRINQGGQYYSQGTSNDPWNNRYTNPPSNIYLPVPPPYVAASVPFVKHPIAGIYHNTGTPTGNYPVLTRKVIPSIGSRFGADDWIWEVRYVGGQGPSSAPSGSAGGGNNVAGGGFSQPSRPPQTIGPPDDFRPPQTTRPPLTSRPSPAAIPPPTTRRPQGTRTRPPPLIHRENRVPGNAGENRQPSAQSPSQSFVPAFLPDVQNTIRPVQQSTARTTPRTSTAPPVQSEPSKCVWAIVSCCSPNSLSVRYSCFEQMGCHGAFWGYNPCADNLQDAAIGEAESFYEK